MRSSKPQTVKRGLALLYELGTKISLVLLDVVMPELGGFDVLAVMQKERWLDDIPVMMISAEDSPAFIQKAYDMGRPIISPASLI